MDIPSKKGRTSSLAPAKMSSRQLAAMELELRRLGRACVIGEREPERCTVFDEAADRLQDLGLRAVLAAAPAPGAPVAAAEPSQEVEGAGPPPAPTYP